MTICAFAVCMAGASARAQEASPIEVQGVELRTDETVGTVVLHAEKPVEWSTETGKRSLVLFLPHTVPGPLALDRSSRAGLISLVEVGFAVPGGVPTARITVHSRKPFEHEVEGSEAGVIIRLKATGAGASPSETRAETPTALQPASPVDDSGELERALRENDSLRQRVAELHSDRLELRESLDSARKDLADRSEGDTATNRAVELERENRRLIEVVSSQRARLAENRGDSARLSEEVEELTRRLGAAEEGRLTSARAAEASKDLEDKLAQSTARQQQLEAQLLESRSVASSLRSWLSKAPEVLSASAFVVSPGDSCLPLRPEPNSATSVLKCLPAGSPLVALSFRPNWLRVRAEEDKEGWVRVARVAPPDQSRTNALVLQSKDTAELERALARLREVEAGSDAKSRALDTARVDLGEARTESEAAQRKLRALLAEVNLGQLTISADADPCLTVRAGPGTEQRRLDCLESGTAVSVVDAMSSWLSITTAGGVSGWVASRFVQPIYAVETSERTAALERSRQTLEEQATNLGGRLQRAEAGSERKAARIRNLDRELAIARNQSAKRAARVSELEEALAALRSRLELERTEALGALKASRVVVKEDVNPCLSLRQDPAVGSRSLDCLTQGTPAAAVGQAGGWVRLRLQDGREGWASGEFLESDSQRELRRLQTQVADLEDTLARARQAQGQVKGRQAKAEKPRSADRRAAEEARAELERQLEAARHEINRLGPLAGRAGEVPILASALDQARRALEAIEVENRDLEAQVSTYRKELLRRPAQLNVTDPKRQELAHIREPLPVAIKEPSKSVTPQSPLPSLTAEVPVITEPASAILEEVLPVTVPADLRAFAQAWAKAWSDQRVDDYLSCYSATFIPPFGMNRADWSDLRRDRITRPKSIEVKLSNFRTRIDGPDRAMVTFDQEYRSDTFQDRVVKKLALIRQGSLWKISEEIAN